MKRGDVTLADVRAAVSYDPETGIFTRLQGHATTKRCLLGKRAGTFDCTVGYRRIRIHGIVYLEHRLAHFWMTGEWPKHQIDHRDGDRANNAWTNLRACDQSQNSQNMARRKDNTSGFTGVVWERNSQKWSARITSFGSTQYLGYHDTADEARVAYLVAKTKIHKFNPVPRQEGLS